MVKVTIAEIETIRDEAELYREFVDTKAWSFCKMSQNLETSREAIKEWLKEMKYEFEPDNQAMIDYIAFKI